MTQVDRRTESEDLREGLNAYAHTQAELQLSLAIEFRSLWQRPLQEMDGFEVQSGPRNDSIGPLVPDPAIAGQEDVIGESTNRDGGDNDDDDDDEDGEYMAEGGEEYDEDGNIYV